jgi:hypothetical protein
MVTDAGMTLPVGLPTSSVVNSRLEAGKCAVPSSSRPDSAVTSAAATGAGELERSA